MSKSCPVDVVSLVVNGRATSESTKIADIAAGRVKRSPLSWLLMGTGFVATVAGLVYVSRAATRRVQAARSKNAFTPDAACGIGEGGGGLRWRSPTPEPGASEHTGLLAHAGGSSGSPVPNDDAV